MKKRMVYAFFIVLLMALQVGCQSKEAENDKAKNEENAISNNEAGKAPGMSEVASSKNLENENSEFNREKEIEQEAEPIYRDLTLEEAWTIVQERNVTMTVAGDCVNVREKPTTDSAKVGLAGSSAVVYIICEEEGSDDGYPWCYVIFEKMESETGTDEDGNKMISIGNKYHLGYIRKDLLK